MTVFSKISQTEQIYSLFKEFGSYPMAYHTLQPQMEYYINDYGYIAYRKYNRNIFVLGDPVCDFNFKEILLKSFIDRFPKASFAQVNKDTAEILYHYDYNSAAFGYETTLPIPYSLSGKNKREVRNLYNAALRADLKVQELQNRSEIFDQVEKFLPVSSPSQRGKYSEEFEFLSIGLSNTNEPDVRIFGGYLNNRLIGFSIFDPIFSNNIIKSYCEVIPRRLPDAPKGTRVFILIKAMQKFENEGIRNVNLGLMPFLRKKDCSKDIPFKENSILKSIFYFNYNYGKFIFNFKGLSFHKSRFRGIEKPVFYATRRALPFLELIQVHQLTTKQRLFGF